MNNRFEYTEHTADLGIRAYGATLKELFANAAEALFEVMVPVEMVQARRRQVVDVRAPALEDLLVCWLNELLYLFDSEGLLFRRYEITHLDVSSLRATAIGEPLDLSRHEVRTGVKAATYHHLSVGKKDGQWECQILLDL